MVFEKWKGTNLIGGNMHNHRRSFVKRYGGESQNRPRSRKGKLVVRLAVGAVSAALVGLGVFPSAWAESAHAGASTTLTTIEIAQPDPNIAFLPFYIGEYDGLFKKAGLRVKVVTMSVPLQTAELVAGKVQFLGAVAVGEQNAIAKDPTLYPIKLLEVSSVYAFYDLIGSKSTKSIKDVVGQTVAGDESGAQGTLFIEQVLKTHGVSTSTYSIDYAGTGPAAAALLAAGKVAATMVKVEQETSAKFRGFPILATGKGVVSLGSGLAATNTYVAHHRAVVKKLVGAVVQATKIAVTNEKKSVNALRKGLANDHYDYSTSVWKKTWQGAKYIFNPSGRPTTSEETIFAQQIMNVDKLPSPPSEGELWNFSFLPKQGKRG